MGKQPVWFETSGLQQQHSYDEMMEELWITNIQIVYF